MTERDYYVLRRKIERYTQLCVDMSWVGSRPPQEVPVIQEEMNHAMKDMEKTLRKHVGKGEEI